MRRMLENFVIFIYLPICAAQRQVEMISDVKVEPTSVTVFTATAGLDVTNSIVKISATNLRTNQTLTKDYSLVFILRPTWGEYKLSPMQASTWYSIAFHSETRRSPVHVNRESRVVRTLPAEGAIVDDRQEDIHTQAILVNNARETSISLTASNRASDLFDMLVRADLLCTTVNDTKYLKLNGNETEDSIRFAINKVVERQSNSTQVVARLEDDSCSRLCWSVWLTSLYDGTRSEHSQNCTAVEHTNVQVSLRNLVRVISLEDDSVTILTQYADSSQPEGDAVVELTVREMGNGGGNSNSSTSRGQELSASFTPESPMENYTIDGLVKGAWYILNYTYSITEPLVYTDYKVEIFKSGAGAKLADTITEALLETATTETVQTGEILGGGASRSNEVDQASIPDNSETHRLPDTTNDPYGMEITMMDLTLTRTDELGKYEIAARILPFCGEHGQEIILGSGNSSVLSVNITTARAHLVSLGQNSTSPNGRPVDADMMPDFPDNCETLCWSYEMFVDGVEERQTLNEHCRRFSLILDESYAGRMISSNVLIIILVSVCSFVR